MRDTLTRLEHEMCACLETLTIAAYVFATTFRLPRPGPVGKVTDDEIVALAVAQAITGMVSDRGFWGRSVGCCRDSFPICLIRRSTTGGCGA